jgi:hypothetical protein
MYKIQVIFKERLDGAQEKMRDSNAWKAGAVQSHQQLLAQPSILSKQ